jgi:hypothetical protein
MNIIKLSTPVGANLLGVQTEHREAVAGVLPAGFYDSTARCQVNSREKDGFAACFASALHHCIAVIAELLAIQMAVRVDVLQISN